jgi:hypothetical protein
MKKTDIRRVFATFQGLNLAILREDVRRGLVAREHWFMKNQYGHIETLCPIAHGWVGPGLFRMTSHGWLCMSVESARFLGEAADNADRFIEWWDGCDPKYTTKRLLEILDDLWAERLADADAVQGVIAEAGAVEEVPCLLTT